MSFYHATITLEKINQTGLYRIIKRPVRDVLKNTQTKIIADKRIIVILMQLYQNKIEIIFD